MFELYNPIQEQLNTLRDMRRYHQEMQDADVVASFNIQFANSLEDEEPESIPVLPECKASAKQRRAARRKQNAKHKKADRLHGKGTYIFRYKENGELKEVVSGNEYRSLATWVRTMHSWGDPEEKKRKIPRTQSINVHKDTVPVPEQEPIYVGVYGTLEVCKGITVTMEWDVPEAVKGEPT